MMVIVVRLEMRFRNLGDEMDIGECSSVGRLRDIVSQISRKTLKKN